MIYRARNSKAVLAWVADKRGAFTHGGETVCPGFHLWRGFVGCPAWKDGKPCTYCFLRSTFRHDPELLKGVAWGGELPDCAGCEHVVAVGTSDPDRCDLQCPSPLDVTPARAAVEKWLAEGQTCATCSTYPMCERRNPYLVGNAWTQCESEYRPMVLNAGELADSLGFSPEENPHIGMLLDQLRALGNAVVPAVVARAWRELYGRLMNEGSEFGAGATGGMNSADGDGATEIRPLGACSAAAGPR